jgi:16S rRNA (cytosine1402-N4)-methyltransferase
VTIIQENFCHAAEVLESLQIRQVDAVLLDLGLSSDQLRAGERGFSFQQEGTIDMRFDPTEGRPAWQLLAELPERMLADIIYQFGEERYSRRIAKAIVAQRRKQPIKSTSQLADIVRRCVPFRGRQRIDPATRTFQALRIAVNEELASLERFLTVLPRILGEGGRAAIISFHSLEDRLVKNAFRQMAGFEMITRKPVRPSDDEVRENSRARSARLRVVARSPSGTAESGHQGGRSKP